MSRWLSISACILFVSPSAILALTPPARAASISSSSVGPAPTAEGDVLWREGQARFGEGEYAQARPLLQRLVDRHPGHPGFTDAHRLLGLTLLTLKQPEKAKAPLRYYIQAKGRSDDAQRARLDLARAELQTHRFPEALLLAKDIERDAKRGTVDSRIRAAAYLMQAHALLAQSRTKEAVRALKSGKDLIGAVDIPLRGDAAQIGLELKLHECSLLPGPSESKLDEAQRVAAFERRGQCLAEGLIGYRDLLKIPHLPSATAGTDRISSAHATFAQACAHPASPAGKRTASQKAQYLTELKALLKKSCGSRIDLNSELLEAMKDDIPQPMRLLWQRAIESIHQSRSS